MNPKDQTSLNKLYQQRKSTLKAPASLTQRLMASKPKKSKLAQWSVALPTIAASVLVVFIVWPTAQTTFNAPEAVTSSDLDLMSREVSESDLSLKDSMVASQAMTDHLLMEEAELTVQEMNDSVSSAMAKSVANNTTQTAPEPIADAKEARVTTIVATPAEKPRPLTSLSKTPDIAPAEQVKSSVAKLAAAPVAAEARLKQEAQNLKVLDGKKGEFLNCENEIVKLDAEIEFALGTWLKASTSENDGWQFEVLEVNPCQ